jgi:hypothetical protein
VGITFVITGKGSKIALFQISSKCVSPRLFSEFFCVILDKYGEHKEVPA